MRKYYFKEKYRCLIIDEERDRIMWIILKKNWNALMKLKEIDESISKNKNNAKWKKKT